MPAITLQPTVATSVGPGVVAWNDPQDVVSPGNATAYYPNTKSGRLKLGNAVVSGDAVAGTLSVSFGISNNAETGESLVFSGYQALPPGSVVDSVVPQSPDFETVDYNETGNDDNARVNSPIAVVVNYH